MSNKKETIIRILYEDNHLIAVVKPGGILSQGDVSGDRSIMDEVKSYLKEKYKKPGKVFLGLLHRLDRPVSGIMLFAKTSKGASRLSEQFRNRAIEKTYHAVVVGKPEDEKGILLHALTKKNKKAKVSEKGGEALLEYEVIKSNGKFSLLKIKIATGKFHQIRAQLSSAGFPILGDVKYHGSAWGNKNSIALCATGLSFETATEGKVINLKVDLPKEWSSHIHY